MNRTTLGLICCRCGDPIPGPAPHWKKGAPVCRACLFSFPALRSGSAKRSRIRFARKGVPAVLWLGLIIMIFTGFCFALF